MLTLTSLKKRTNSEGKEFLTLELQGGLEMIQSQNTGRFFAVVRKTVVTANFSEEVAKNLIGSQIPGKIVREECDPYEYRIPNSEETLLLMHRWSYQPEGAIAHQM